MTALVITIHIIVCVLLVLIVLLQSGKGAEMGVSLGGGAGQTLFGAAGPATILTKITTAVAVIFMVTSLTLAVLSKNRTGSSVMSDLPAPASVEQPAQPEKAAPAGTTAPAPEQAAPAEQTTPAAQPSE